MKTKERPVCLANLGEGAALERFDRELEKVLKNIADPNTAAKKPRKVVLEVTFNPSDDRSMGNVLISAHSKIQPPQHLATVVMMGREEGRFVAREFEKEQTSMFSNVANLDDHKAGKEQLQS